jgi:hypothetical protein
LANVGESGESEQTRLANVGESGTFLKKAILASTQICQKWQISGKYSNSINSLSGGHCLIVIHIQHTSNSSSSDFSVDQLQVLKICPPMVIGAVVLHAVDPIPIDPCVF